MKLFDNMFDEFKAFEMEKIKTEIHHILAALAVFAAVFLLIRHLIRSRRKEEARRELPLFDRIKDARLAYELADDLWQQRRYRR